MEGMWGQAEKILNATGFQWLADLFDHYEHHRLCERVNFCRNCLTTVKSGAIIYMDIFSILVPIIK